MNPLNTKILKQQKTRDKLKHLINKYNNGQTPIYEYVSTILCAYL